MSEVNNFSMGRGRTQGYGDNSAITRRFEENVRYRNVPKTYQVDKKMIDIVTVMDKYSKFVSGWRVKGRSRVAEIKGATSIVLSLSDDRIPTNSEKNAVRDRLHSVVMNALDKVMVKIKKMLITGPIFISGNEIRSLAELLADVNNRNVVDFFSSAPESVELLRNREKCHFCSLEKTFPKIGTVKFRGNIHTVSARPPLGGVMWAKPLEINGWVQPNSTTLKTFPKEVLWIKGLHTDGLTKEDVFSIREQLQALDPLKDITFHLYQECSHLHFHRFDKANLIDDYRPADLISITDLIMTASDISRGVPIKTCFDIAFPCEERHPAVRALASHVLTQRSPIPWSRAGLVDARNVRALLTWCEGLVDIYRCGPTQFSVTHENARFVGGTVMLEGEYYTIVPPPPKKIMDPLETGLTVAFNSEYMMRTCIIPEHGGICVRSRADAGSVERPGDFADLPQDVYDALHGIHATTVKSAFKDRSEFGTVTSFEKLRYILDPTNSVRGGNSRRPFTGQLMQRLEKGGTVLDVGCLSGGWSKEIMRMFKSAKVTGVDIVKKLGPMSTQEAKQFEFIHASYSTLIGNTYDLVVSDMQKITIDDLRAFIGMVKTGGSLIVKVQHVSYRGHHGDEMCMDQVAQMYHYFATVTYYKPPRSRLYSGEVYVGFTKRLTERAQPRRFMGGYVEFRSHLDSARRGSNVGNRLAAGTMIPSIPHNNVIDNDAFGFVVSPGVHYYLTDDVKLSAWLQVGKIVGSIRAFHKGKLVPVRVWILEKRDAKFMYIFHSLLKFCPTMCVPVHSFREIPDLKYRKPGLLDFKDDGFTLQKMVHHMYVQRIALMIREFGYDSVIDAGGRDSRLATMIGIKTNVVDPNPRTFPSPRFVTFEKRLVDETDVESGIPMITIFSTEVQNSFIKNEIRVPEHMIITFAARSRLSTPFWLHKEKEYLVTTVNGEERAIDKYAESEFIANNELICAPPVPSYDVLCTMVREVAIRFGMVVPQEVVTTYCQSYNHYKIYYKK
jgi:23S rRNA U2552 (ribose-2'-O)-methylase RlmE/FtsJ